MVIGGGVIGLMIAYYLNRDNHQVTLVDKGLIGSGASEGNCGLILSHILPVNMPGAPLMALKWAFNNESPLHLKPGTLLSTPAWFLNFLKHCTEKSVQTAAQALAPLLLSVRDDFAELISGEHLDCDWKSEGILAVFESLAAFEHSINEVSIEREFGIRVEKLSQKELRKQESALSEKVVGAWYYPDTGHLRPDLFIKALKNNLASNGVTLIENAEFQSFITSGGVATQARINSTSYEADYFIMATGAWSGNYEKQLKQRLPVQPGKGYAYTFEGISSPVRVPTILAEKKVVLTPFSKAFRLGGTMEFAGFDDRINQQRIKALVKAAAPYFSGNSFGSPSEEWSGWRPMTFDGLPFIDFLPDIKNVLVAAGHNMIGVSMAPATGKLVKDLIAKGASSLQPNPFGFERLG